MPRWMPSEQTLKVEERANLQMLLSMVLREKSSFMLFPHIAYQLPLYHLFFAELQMPIQLYTNFPYKMGQTLK